MTLEELIRQLEESAAHNEHACEHGTPVSSMSEDAGSGRVAKEQRRIIALLREIAADATKPAAWDAEDYKERLKDLLDLQSELSAIGGGPGFKERFAKALARGNEMFEP